MRTIYPWQWQHRRGRRRNSSQQDLSISPDKPSLVLWSLSWNKCRSIFHSWITISMFETIFWWHSTTSNIDLLFQVSQQRTHVQLQHQPGNCMKYFWLKYFLIVMLSGCNKLCGDVSILLVLNHAQNSATQINWYHTDAAEIFWCRRHLWSWATMKNEIIQHWALMTSVRNAVDIDHNQWSYQDIRLATQQVASSSKFHHLSLLVALVLK